VIFGGCPKRQTGPQVVYVPTPPPAATPSQSDQSIVVQAPAPPAPLEAKPDSAPQTPPEPTPNKPARPKRAESKAPPEEPPGAEVPALQSAISSGEATALQGQVVRLQEGIEKRILVLNREGLSPSQRKMLDDARGFLQQSQKALQKLDLDLAYNWAHKADQVVASLEQPR
jgi:outer membrane biosynthesis protein TonB